MQLTARLTQHLDPETGKGAKGPWTRHRFVVTTETQYPKTIQIDAYENERNKPILSAAVGDMLKVDFDLASKDYNGKWYTSATAHKIEIVSDSVGTSKAQPQRASVATQPAMPRHKKPTTMTYDSQSFDGGDDDSLPF